MKISVSQLLVRYMERLGIRVIFGMPGAHILPVYDNLFDSAIEAVLAKHEQGAAFMACGYARSSGTIGACITTAGPGATNLVTGIANAYADKLPVLVITGETSTHIFGKGGLQESSGEGGTIDQVALFKGITRYNKIVERTDYLANVLNQASKILLANESGPVLLSFPFNVQKELVEEEVLDQVTTRGRTFSLHEDSPPLEQLTELLCNSSSPVIVAGYGALKADAQQQVAQLSHILSIPVASSLKAKGIVDENSALALGSLGVTSSGRAYQYIVEKADLLLFLGASFNERTSYLWDSKILQDKKIVQIDLDSAQLEKVFDADIAIHGDIKQVLAIVLQKLAQRGVSQPASDIRHTTIAELKATKKQDYAIFTSGFALVENFYQQLANYCSSGAMVFDDNIIFAQNFFTVTTGNRYYPNSGISSLGHAIPAAIGASFYAEGPTFAILGDGGFQMCCMELMTAVNYNKPLNVVMFNNSTMGLIRKNQHQHYQERYINCDFINPDYQKLAESFGINYYKIVTAEDIQQLFSSVNVRGAINLIEFMIDKDLFPNYSSKR